MDSYWNITVRGRRGTHEHTLTGFARFPGVRERPSSYGRGCAGARGPRSRRASGAAWPWAGQSAASPGPERSRQADATADGPESCPSLRPALAGTGWRDPPGGRRRASPGTCAAGRGQPLLGLREQPVLGLRALPAGHPQLQRWSGHPWPAGRPSGSRTGSLRDPCRQAEGGLCADSASRPQP